VVAHPTEELAAYAIGTLDPEDQATVEAHVRGCDPCRAEVAAYEATAWRIAEAVAAEPPGGLREAVIARARAEQRRPQGIASSILDVFRRPIPAFVPAALIVVLVIAFGGYVGARRDADRYATALAAAGNARIVALSPSAERPQARGALVQPSNGTTAYLILDLPAPPAGKTWQAWVVRGETPLAAGISGDVEVIFLTVPLQAGDVVAVTLEGAGGAAKPTTTPVLTAKVG
jgi:anti-sigma factor RsiW